VVPDQCLDEFPEVERVAAGPRQFGAQRRAGRDADDPAGDLTASAVGQWPQLQDVHRLDDQFLKA